MSNRNFRVQDISTHLGITWGDVDLLTRSGVFPCDRVLHDGKVARLYDLDECTRYFGILTRMLALGISKHTCYRNVRSVQLKDNTLTSKPVHGAAPLRRLENVPGTVEQNKEENKNDVFMIVLVLFIVAAIVFAGVVTGVLFSN